MVALFEDTHPPVSAPMHVGVRSTWLNSVDLSRDKYIEWVIALNKSENPLRHHDAEQR
jgi:hypothetical protein